MNIHPKTHFLIIFFLIIAGALFVTLISLDPPAEQLPAERENNLSEQKQLPTKAEISESIDSFFSWFGFDTN